MQNRGNYANRHNLIQIPIQTNINLNSRPSFTRSQTNVLHKLKIAHLNIRSLRNTSHLIETKELVKSHKIDVLTRSKTWLNSTVTNGEIAIDDYKIFRQDRLHKKGGGVCAFVKKVLKVTIINELTNTSESNFQQLWIKLQNKKIKTKIICVIYRPPVHSRETCKTLGYASCFTRFSRILLTFSACIINTINAHDSFSIS